MGTELIILLAIILALIAGASLFVVVKLIRSKATNTKDRELDLTIVTDAGICRVLGTKNTFEMYFERESVGFIVKDGVITQYKTKKRPGYTNYILGSGYNA